MNASEIVTRALRRIRVVAKDEAPDADDMAEGVKALNSMMFGWKAHGVDVEHVELEPADAMTIGTEYEQAVIDLLAARLGPEYNEPYPDADYAWRMLQARFLVLDEVEIDTPLTRLPTQRIRWQTGFL